MLIIYQLGHKVLHEKTPDFWVDIWVDSKKQMVSKFELKPFHSQSATGQGLPIEQ